jgi:hypothetical protein
MEVASVLANRQGATEKNDRMVYTAKQNSLSTLKMEWRCGAGQKLNEQSRQRVDVSYTG